MALGDENSVFVGSSNTFLHLRLARNSKTATSTSVRIPQLSRGAVQCVLDESYTDWSIRFVSDWFSSCHRCQRYLRAISGEYVLTVSLLDTTRGLSCSQFINVQTIYKIKQSKLSTCRKNTTQSGAHPDWLPWFAQLRSPDILIDDKSYAESGQ